MVSFESTSDSLSSQLSSVMKRKGIVLAGGLGSRLFPLTLGVNKHLLPIYDKPMVYYPLSVLMLAQIQDVMLISSQQDLPAFQRLLGDGSRFGVNLQYGQQTSPSGVAESFLIAERFLDDACVTLILGDNLFYGQGLSPKLIRASESRLGAMVFGYEVSSPQQFGVVEVDAKGHPLSLEEKPSDPRSALALTGLYFYDNEVIEIAKQVTPSERGELEITSVNRQYLQRDQLSVEVLGRGYTWMDTGTPSALVEATQFVQAIEHNQGFKVACLEEIAFRNRWITQQQLLQSATTYGTTHYATYLRQLADHQA